MKRVLILTASYGSGHNAAARCLAPAFERERCAVTVVDHFRELVSPLFERASRALYYAILRRAPLLWSVGYALGDWMASDSPLALGVTRVGTRRLAVLLETLRPDAVVTVHATPAITMSALVAECRPTPPHTSVVTDFFAHNQWIARHIDCYCVAAEEVKHEFIARGIPPERLIVTGMPVRANFAEPVDPAATRAALGLSDRAPVVLAMAGSRGSLGRLPDVVRALDTLERPLQGLVVAGHDVRLRPTLEPPPASTVCGPEAGACGGPGRRNGSSPQRSPSWSGRRGGRDPDAARCRRGRRMGRVRVGRAPADARLCVARQPYLPARGAHVRR